MTTLELESALGFNPFEPENVIYWFPKFVFSNGANLCRYCLVGMCTPAGALRIVAVIQLTEAVVTEPTAA